jgi:hypothetical protein
MFRILLECLPSLGVSKAAIDMLPQDPRTYGEVIDLDYEEETYVVCPKCAFLFLLDARSSHIRECTFQPSPQLGKCGKKLYSMKGGSLRPIMLFRRRKFDDWLKSFLLRPGRLGTLDAAWAKARANSNAAAADIWSGTFLQSFKGPCEDRLFRDAEPDETRLLFSLAVDWFNPYFNKISGKSASTGVMFMSCLNLPIEERYKEENIYLVGIMPGPKQPAHVDGILQPLVNDLLRYWRQGVYFVGIPGVTRARLIRVALVQLICDLPAARKIAGFPGHAAKFGCSVCMSDRDDIATGTSPCSAQKLRTSHGHRAAAQTYKNILQTSGHVTAEKWLKATSDGVRWSPLNDLPYWDPVKCTILDVMHLILLGICQFHWRKFWNGDGVFKSPRKGQEHLTVRINREPEQQGSIDQSHANMDRAELSIPPAAGDLENLVPEDEDQHESAIEDPEEVQANETEPVDSTNRAKFLPGRMMFLARLTWIHREDKELSSLNTSQILCLLEENQLETISAFKDKKELVGILQVGSLLSSSTHI